jgi:serine/threonine kinase 16
VAKVLRHLTEALVAVHQCGFRHGDIKPANILLTEGLDAVLTDFGSAGPLEVGVGTRREAEAVMEGAARASTAPYRPPELFHTPSQCTIGGASDVWSVGCVVYCMFFSRSPFECLSPSPSAPPSASALSVLALMAASYPIPPNGPWPEDYLHLFR